jgi:tetratricopeptide (TPR) repeat protein
VLQSLPVQGPPSPLAPPVVAASAERASPAYRAAFAAGVTLVCATLVAGFARSVWHERRVPGLEQDPLALARRAVAGGGVRPAVGDLRAAVALNPGDWRLLLDVADQLRAADDLAGSLEISRRALALRPDSADAHVAVALTLFRQGRLEEAGAAYEQAARLAPRAARVHAGLGEVRLDQDRYADAAAAFSRALAVSPDDAGVHNSLGIALALAGEPDRAVPHFARAVALAPRADFRANLERAKAASRGARP